MILGYKSPLNPLTMGSFHPTEPHVATIQPCLLPSLSSPICLPHPQSLFSSWNLGIKVLECEQEAADQKEEDKHASFSYRALQNKPPHNFFKKLFLITSFHYHLSPSYPCPPPPPMLALPIATLLSMSISSFSFLLNPFMPQCPTPTQSCQTALSL